MLAFDLHGCCVCVCESLITLPVCSYFTYCFYFLHEGFYFFYLFISLDAFLRLQVGKSLTALLVPNQQRLSAVLLPLYSSSLLWPAFTQAGRSHSQPSLQSLRLRESAGSLCRVQSKCMRARLS